MRITVETTIAAPIDLVWQAFNDPDDILKWDASEEWRTISASNDLKVGGLLELRIEPRHDGTAFDFVATYTAVEPMRLIEWRTGDNLVARVEFNEIDAGVVVHQTFDAEPTTPIDEQRCEWQGVLDSFARHVMASNVCR